MNQKVIREINSILHIGLYKSVTLHYKAIVSLFVSLFVVTCILGILSLNPYNTHAQLCATIAGWFGYAFIAFIVLISIDRGMQLYQIAKIRKKNDIQLSTVMNQHITASKRPWMVV